MTGWNTLVRHSRVGWIAAGMALALCGAALALAGWPGETNQAVTVADTDGDQTAAQGVPDGAGGTIVVWEDYRSGTESDIFAQRVTLTGDRAWDILGIPVCTATGLQLRPRIASDGSGGAIITWYDYRSGAGACYAQRIDANGQVLWTADGVLLSASTGTQWEPDLVADGLSGAIVAWYEESANTTTDIYAQRVSGTGDILWGPNGTPVSLAPQGQAAPIMVGDGSGGAVIAWYDFRLGVFQLFAQRLDGTGSALWTADGVSVCPSSDFQYFPAIAPDGEGGAVLAWHDYRGAPTSDVYAQRILGTGSRAWSDDGVLVCGAAGYQYTPALERTGAGQWVVGWTDGRSGVAFDVYAQALDETGAGLWTTDGIVVTDAVNDQRAVQLAADGRGGAFVAWEDGRTSPNPDLYADHLGAGGLRRYSPANVPLYAAPNEQLAPALVPTGAGGAIIVTNDYRSGTDFRVSALRLVLANAPATFGLWVGAGVGELVAVPGYAGADPGALDGLDPADLPLPGTLPPSYVTLSFLEPGGASSSDYIQDVRQEDADLAITAQQWRLNVATSRPAQTLQLHFAEDRIPPGFTPVLYGHAPAEPVGLRDQPLQRLLSPPVAGDPVEFVILLGDSTDPSVSITSPNGGEVLIVGIPATIAWTVLDGSGILKQYLSYAPGNGATVELIDSVDGLTTSYLWTPPSASLAARIEITAVDSVLNRGVDSSDNTFSVVAGDSVSLVTSGGWQMIGIPLLQEDMSPGGIFDDDIGGSGYVAYGYDGFSYVLPDTLRQGSGYWLLTDSPSPVDAVGAVVPVVSRPVSTGWSMIGNPFPAPFARSHLRFNDGIETKSFDVASSAGWITSVLYGYVAPGYADESVALQVWTGYWLLASRPLTILYDLAVPKAGAAPAQPASWSVQIAATFTAGGRDAADRIARLGAAPEATAGYDQLLDVPRPPRVPSAIWVEVGFGTRDSGRALLARDIRSPGSDAWPLIVTTSGPGAVRLSWEADSAHIAPGLELADHATGSTIPMNGGGGYAFEMDAMERLFTVRATDSPGGAVLPEEYALLQNYPNPFNPATVVRYALPEDARVALKVYTLLGEEVATIVESTLPAGVHEAVVDGSALSSGIYLCRLTVRGSDGAVRFTQARKLALIK